MAKRKRNKRSDPVPRRGIRDGIANIGAMRAAILALARRQLPPDRWVAAARKIALAFERESAAVLQGALLNSWFTAARMTAAVVGGLPNSFAPVLPPLPPAFVVAARGDDPARFPLIERAALDLYRRQIMTRDDFDRLTNDAKRTAFTVARVTTLQTVDAVRAALVDSVRDGTTLREFRERVDARLAGRLGPSQVEALFRTHLGQAYSAGQREILDHPMVSDEFPYVWYVATHDGRVRPLHLALETMGLDGTAIYRRDDPIWRRFWPPWDWNCRCRIIPLSLEDAARRGVREAQRWLSTDTPPARPAWVRTPVFSPPPGWPTRDQIQPIR